MNLLTSIQENVICGNSDLNAPIKKGEPGVKELVQQALDQGLSPKQVLEQGGGPRPS